MAQVIHTGLMIMLAAFHLASVSGCAIVQYGTHANEGPVLTSPAPTRATTKISSSDLKNGTFIGIGMSGGGSRAANFSAAALLQLESLGILQQATALSSVSGSSLTAAYYGLFSEDKIHHWNPEQIRERLAKNFELEWFSRWFLPWNIGRYWFTGFDRSDIMADVFDHNLFEDKTFGQMPNATPRILINATSLTDNGASYLFTDEAFNKIGSRLDKYAVSRAVMASGAFPGAFHNVTLRDYTQPKQYVHLFDGGPSDNLGINSLRKVARDLYLGPESEHPKKCLVLIVDAYTQGWNLSREDPDTRKAITDFVIDTNALEASSVLLALRRDRLLEEMGISLDENTALDVYQPFHLFAEADDPALKKHPKLKDVECHAWLITFQRLQHLTHLPNAGTISAIVNNIPTRYTLLAPHGLGATEAQEALFNAAEMLIKGDKETLAAICKDFGDNFPAMKCSK
ncbi:MAG TPA: patatin-like phospholipase family protein [Candidatus Binatia bacterium]|nr:patatin-like phospholipase family protein [Candidatus Binatia bacterium]